MSKHAFIVSACKKYIPELCALLNSLEIIRNKHDVFLIGYELPDELVLQFSKLSFNVFHYDIPEAEARQFGGESEILCRKRYWYAAEWGKKYDAICVLDADMMIIRNVDNFFEIAAKCDQILGVTLEQKTTYGTDVDSHFHQRVLGEHLVKKETWNPKDMCCTPMFINAQTYEMQLKKAWDIFTWGFPETNFKAPDQQSFNCILVAEGLTDRVTLLPNMCWVGSNEKLLKPYTHVTTQRDGLLWTESGEPIYIIHGQFYKSRWRNCQVLNRQGCARGYLDNPSAPGAATEKAVDLAKASMNCLYEWFKKCLNSGPLTIDTAKAYVENGHPEVFVGEEARV